MKKIAAAAAALLMLMMTGCEMPDLKDAKVNEHEVIAAAVSTEPAQQSANSAIKTLEYNNYNGCGLYLITDPTTGVQYIAFTDFKSGGGITPRLNADGSLHIAEQE